MKNFSKCILAVPMLFAFNVVHTDVSLDNTNSSKRFVVDKIVARVNGNIILQSDLEQPRISTENSRPYTLDEAIMEELMVAYAINQHMVPTQLDIERQITSIKIQNGLQDIPEKEFERQLKESGFTLSMYKQQIGRQIALENVRRAEVYDKMIISSQEVESYYKKNPEQLPESYLLEVCTVDAKNALDKTVIDQASWEKLDWINKEDLSDIFKCVERMKQGEASAPISNPENVNTVQFVRVVEKQEQRLKTLDERYAHIDQLLQKKKRLELVQAMENKIKKQAVITYL